MEFTTSEFLSLEQCDGACLYFRCVQLIFNDTLEEQPWLQITEQGKKMNKIV